jgi:Mg-chelatase subunit ChlD
LILGQDAAPDSAPEQSPTTDEETADEAGADDSDTGRATGLLSPKDQAIDTLLDQLYNTERSASLASSAPYLARWITDIQNYFPAPVIKILQQDAIERLDLKLMLLEPEVATTIVPDLNLVTTILLLKSQLEPRHLPAARQIIQRIADDIIRRLKAPLARSITGSLNRASRKNRPRPSEIDWNRTIRANLKHYSREHRTIIPEKLIGFSRKRVHLRDVILCIDQSGSMAESVVYASLTGAILATIPAFRTQIVAFDTDVVDLTPHLTDPVELLLGFQLGGGTDINSALRFCQQNITRPNDTILVLISDLIEGGNRNDLLRRAQEIKASGVQFIALLSLTDSGTPTYDSSIAQSFAEFGIPTFACTPDLLPDLLSAAIERRNLLDWTAAHDIATHR